MLKRFIAKLVRLIKGPPPKPNRAQALVTYNKICEDLDNLQYYIYLIGAPGPNADHHTFTESALYQLTSARDEYQLHTQEHRKQEQLDAINARVARSKADGQ